MRPAGKVVDESEIIPDAYLTDNFPFAAAEALLGVGTQGMLCFILQNVFAKMFGFL